ncbi:hypothetical protein [Stenomitos frigidus]|uniref:hypothetical protein n=1 Tax=Stenomitos frigidus TaxID=1886765 RepID=UPI0011B27B9A|nr:hypothetical protein [Stenomitos frigidus]
MSHDGMRSHQAFTNPESIVSEGFNRLSVGTLHVTSLQTKATFWKYHPLKAAYQTAKPSIGSIDLA